MIAFTQPCGHLTWSHVPTPIGLQLRHFPWRRSYSYFTRTSQPPVNRHPALATVIHNYYYFPSKWWDSEHIEHRELHRQSRHELAGDWIPHLRDYTCLGNNKALPSKDATTNEKTSCFDRVTVLDTPHCPAVLVGKRLATSSTKVSGNI